MAERVVVVVSYQTRGALYPERLINEVSRGLRHIFARKTKVEITVVRDDQVLRVLEALESEQPIIFEDPPIRERKRSA